MRHDNARRQKGNTAIASFDLGVSGAVRGQSKFEEPFAKQTQSEEQFVSGVRARVLRIIKQAMDLRTR